MPNRRKLGFTLIELLVVIAILAVLASILFPALAKAKQAGQKAACVSNLRQLGLAMRMYLDDFSDYYPAANTLGDLQPEEWIRWNSVFNSPDREESRRDLYRHGIVPYIEKFSTNLFTCPSDRLLQRIHKDPFAVPRELFRSQQYLFSYTFNSPGYRGSIWEGHRSLGMASTWTVNPFRHLVKVHASSTKNPAGKIMFADERMAYEYEPGRTVPGTFSAGWEWPVNDITSRHGKRGTVTFADGHVEVILPGLAKMPEHHNPGFE